MRLIRTEAKEADWLNGNIITCTQCTHKWQLDCMVSARSEGESVADSHSLLLSLHFLFFFFFFLANCPCSPHSNLPILSSSSTLLIEWRIYPLILIPHTKRGWIISFLSHPAWVGPLQKFPCCASHKRTVTHYPSSTSLRVFASSPLPPAVWEQVEEVTDGGPDHKESCNFNQLWIVLWLTSALLLIWD